jgi:hypothetical protein
MDTAVGDLVRPRIVLIATSCRQQIRRPGRPFKKTCLPRSCMLNDGSSRLGESSVLRSLSATTSFPYSQQPRYSLSRIFDSHHHYYIASPCHEQSSNNDFAQSDSLSPSLCDHAHISPHHHEPLRDRDFAHQTRSLALPSHTYPSLAPRCRTPMPQRARPSLHRLQWATFSDSPLKSAT